MLHRPMGGRSVPVVGQGTWQVERDARKRVVEALRVGLDLGLTHLDTAEMYGDGLAEELVAEAIAGRRREDLTIVSKVLPSNASHDGTLAACDASLARLKTDHLDVYLLHWPGRHPLERTIAAFEKLVEQGKARAWGVSNFDVDDLEKALSIAGPGRIACNQVLYHLEERSIEHAVVPWCQRHGVAVVAYSPFGSGQFPSEHSTGGRVLAEVARAHGATPRQVALAFLLRLEGMLTIPKAATAEHVRDNAGAGDVRLTVDEIARIDAEFPPGRPRGLAMI